MDPIRRTGSLTVRRIDHNVAIIGGGQSGSTFAFALRRAGIGKVTLIDAAGDAASSGPG
ncbi:NAD(P)-binding protein [Bradyrhizobium sp. 146]|uniref:NAD(P)-binding protein n=1 Tax=Bradyrhizobium sp. 146 TaxID=2782622 RepID=UPI001FF79A4B|nr:NAD(P)-binding protein [Bradyrhizobium sp. 146]